MTDTFGPFVLTKLVGRGGMAEVFLAHRDGEPADPPVVLKRLRPEVALDPEYGKRLALEAQLASLLSHPSLVKLIEYGRVGDCHYLVMAQVRGHSLRRLLEHAMDHDRPPPLAAALGIAEAVLGGLSAMHEARDELGKRRPFLHRDVTPGNVIVDHDGRGVLIDYGIAKDVFGPSITMVGKVVGTSRYMAPEHRMSQRCDARADVFSISRILFELITARHPWPPLPAHRELLRVVFDPPERTPEVDARLPDDVREVLWRGLACAAEERHASATAMLEALRATPTWAAQEAQHGTLGAAVQAWVRSTGVIADEALRELVIDSPSVGGANVGVAWSRTGRIASKTPVEAVPFDPPRTSDAPDARVLSIPPLAPARGRDSTRNIAVVARPKRKLVLGVVVGAVALVGVVAAWALG